ncbi:MAG TPA: enoyl-CoA hydratase-related protein, partial [Cyclobacteriaceae bacterium]|nr:enoyl-CoA hydratase-related protein [Cyclobacteriaceae bacterium]
EAKSIGLVNHVYATQQELLQAAHQMMEKIFAKAPVAVAMVINSVNAGYNFEEAGYQAEANSFAYCTKTDDFKEGTTAFIEKRKPAFKGE